MGLSLMPIIGGGLHVLSRSIVLFRLLHTSNVAGLSLITQEIFLIVYVMRYLDLLALYVDLLDTLVKVFHLGLALSCVLLLRSTVHGTYEAEYDTVPHAAILVPPFLLSLVYHRYIMLIEIFHQFSWYLEPLALLPQFIMLYKKGSYPAWVLVFVALAGAEGIVTNWTLLSNTQEALISNPYGLYAAWVLCGVLVAGTLLLIIRGIIVRRSTGLNESSTKPAFDEEWEAGRFNFADEAQQPLVVVTAASEARN